MASEGGVKMTSPNMMKNASASYGGQLHNASSVDTHQTSINSQLIHEPGNLKLNELTTLLQSPAQRGSRHLDSTLMKMNSRKGSIGPNNPTSWMDSHGQSQ